MRTRNWLVLASLLAAALAAGPAAAGEHPQSKSGKQEAGPKLENLLKAELEGFAGAEVIVSRVTIPPHTSLPKHWHPGEEFGYVLEGSVVLWQDGKDDVECRAGDVVKIPLEQVHTAFTRDEATTLLVFRVHEKGKPERIPVE